MPSHREIALALGPPPLDVSIRPAPARPEVMDDDINVLVEVGNEEAGGRQRIRTYVRGRGWLADALAGPSMNELVGMIRTQLAVVERECFSS